MPQPVKRTERLVLRVSPAEKATIEERAKAAGLKVGEYLRREAGCSSFGRAALRGSRLKVPPPTPVLDRATRGSDYQQRLNAAAMRMPRRTAEQVVRKEEARERAKASQPAVER